MNVLSIKFLGYIVACLGLSLVLTVGSLTDICMYGWYIAMTLKSTDGCVFGLLKSQLFRFDPVSSDTTTLKQVLL